MKCAAKAGWSVSRTAKARFVLVPPAGGKPVILFDKPKDYRSTMNARAALRRGGLVV